MSQLAGWDVPQLRGAVGTLGVVADRLGPWRSRLDALGRQLGDAECWSGPAGAAAAAALVELSTVTSWVTGALGSAQADLAGLTAAAAEAHECAVAARAVAEGAGLRLDEAGLVVGVAAPPAPVMAPDQVAAVLGERRAAAIAEVTAEQARAAGTRAAACAQAAAEQLGGLGGGVAVPVGFTGRPAGVPAVRPPTVPPPGDPRAAADWWAGLSAAEQLAAVAARPGAVGALDGLPGWARDEANRAGLAAALAHLPPGSAGHATARAVQLALAQVAATGQPAQLLLFDPAEKVVAVSVGDLDTAAAVGVLVPGVETTPTDDLTGLVGDARDVAAAAGAAAPGLAVATVAWLGYRTPRWFTSVLPQASRRAGKDLDRALDGLAAARATSGAAPPRVTVVGHSYGTVVAGQAARAPGRLAADAVVLLGSPGTGVGRADRLEVAEVYGAWTAADPISTSDFYGPSPYDPFFGDVALPTELTQGHTDYYDRDRPTLAAIGAVVAGPPQPR